MSNLYELTGSRLALQRKLEVLNLDEETILDTLESESADLAEKVTDIGYVIRNRLSFADSMTAEIARMIERRDAELKRIAAIEKWLLDSMIACNFLKVEDTTFTIFVQKNPPKIEVLDEKQIPDNYWRTPDPKPPVAAPDKRMILEAMKNGIDVPGCAMTQSARLVIK